MYQRTGDLNIYTNIHNIEKAQPTTRNRHKINPILFISKYVLLTIAKHSITMNVILS